MRCHHNLVAANSDVCELVAIHYFTDFTGTEMFPLPYDKGILYPGFGFLMVRESTQQHPQLITTQMYHAIAACITNLETQNGGSLVKLRLIHKQKSTYDIDLTIPAPVHDLRYEWQAVSRILKLPMIIVENNGALHQSEHQVGFLKLYKKIDRSRPYSFTARRPHFLKRRKGGQKQSIHPHMNYENTSNTFT